jgi:hypothetical protein
MRAGGRAALVLALTVGACRARSPDVTSAPDAGAGVRAQAADLPLPGCDVLMPSDVRDLMLPGFTMKEERACPTCGPLCTFRSTSEADTSASVAWDCNPRHMQADVKALMGPTLRAGGEEVPALGRAAVRRAPAQGMLQVMTWDDDTPCALIVTWLGADTDRALDVARSALVATTPAVLATPPAAADAGEP